MNWSGVAPILALAALSVTTEAKAASEDELGTFPNERFSGGFMTFDLHPADPSIPTLSDEQVILSSPEFSANSGSRTILPSQKQLVAQHFEVKRTLKGDRFAKLELPAQGLSLRIDSATGSEGYVPGMHILTSSLAPENAWRRQVDLALAPTGLSEIGLKVKASTYSDRRPMLFGSSIRHGVGELRRWRENNSWDLGLEFKVPQSGISYSGGFGWGEYRYINGGRLESLDNLLSSRPEWERGRSFWQRVDTDILSWGENKVSAYAFYGKASDDYRNYRRRNDTPLVYEGQTLEIGGDATLGKTRFSISRESVDGPNYSFGKTSGRVRFGAIDFGLKNGYSTVHDHEDASWKITDRYWDSSAKFDLKKILGDRFSGGLLPSKLTLKAQKKNGFAHFSGSRSRWDRSKLQVGLSWSGTGAETQMAVGSSITNRWLAEFLDPVQKQEFSLDFSHYRYGDWWDVTVYGAYNSADGIGSASRFLSGGASFSIKSEMWPELSVGIDANGYRQHSSGYAVRSNGVTFSSELNFSKFLPAADTARPPFLILKAYGDWTSNKYQYEIDDNRMEPAVMLMFGTQF